MLVVASRKIDKKHRIYHRYGCIYARRIKLSNRKEMSIEVAERKHYHACKYCAGLRGDVNVHKATFDDLSKKKNMNFTYCKERDILYIQTKIGFWKLFMKEESGEYLLYHRNTYTAGMHFKEAVYGAFHRQTDVKATESMEKIVNYIIAHDRAKITIMDDYRKLPRHTKKQKKYYKAAERKDRRNAIRRLDSIFAALEQEQAGIRQYSFC